MIPTDVPDTAAAGRPGEAQVVSFAPPPGVSGQDCGTLTALVEHVADRVFRDRIHVPLQLEAGELERLQAGELVWLTVCGRGLPAVAVNVGPAPPDVQ